MLDMAGWPVLLNLQPRFNIICRMLKEARNLQKQKVVVEANHMMVMQYMNFLKTYYM